MLRRSFLKWAASLLGGLLARPVFAWRKGPYVHPVFGEYVSHEVRGEVYYHAIFGVKYAYFPVERTLTVRFKDCTVTWVNFNASEDLCGRLRRMSPEELFASAGKIEGDPEQLVFDDEAGLMWETQGCGPRRIPGKKNKFRVSQVILHLRVR